MDSNPVSPRSRSHHARFDSLPNGLESIQTLESPSPRAHQHSNSRTKAHKKSASIGAAADIASHFGMTKLNNSTRDVAVPRTLHAGKYSKREREELLSIQANLTKRIGQEQYLILSQFIDLMDKLAPHITAQQATEMFDQMDPSNNGQIATSLLLHDEFLPRLILDLFHKHDGSHSVHSAHSNGSLPEDFGLEDDDTRYDVIDATDKDNDDNATDAEMGDAQKVKTYKQEIRRLKQWIIEHGQPAVEKVDELQMMLDVYEAERTDKQFELQTFQQQLSTMDDLEKELSQTQTRSHLLLKEHDSLLLTVQDSARQHEMERQKYDEAIREAAEYRKLAAELQEMNDKYRQKNEALSERKLKLEEENQDLRQLMLQFETQQNQQIAEYNQALQVMNDQVQSLQSQMGQGSVKWADDVQSKSDVNLYDDTMSNSSNQSNSNTMNAASSSFRQNRRRRMTYQNDPDNGDAEHSMFAEIDNSLTGRGRPRRDTIRSFYDAHHHRRGQSMASLYTEEHLKQLDEEHEHEEAEHPTAVSFARQESAQSVDSVHDQEQEPAYSRHAAANKTVDDIFEDAVAQELKIELRKQIEAELNEDYQLKLKQHDIEHTMKLHKEREALQQEHQKLKEEYEAEINALKLKLTQFGENEKITNLAETMSFGDDEMVYLNGGGIVGGAAAGGAITNMSTPMSEDDANSDDEKEIYDENMMMDDANRARRSSHTEDETSPLIESKKKMEEKYVDQVLREKKDTKTKKKKEGRETQNNRNDDNCFSCFGLITGTGV